MKTRSIPHVTAVVLLFALAGPGVSTTGAIEPPRTELGVAGPHVRVVRDEVALAFEPNRGQARTGARFTARASGYTLHLGAREAVFVLDRGKELALSLAGGRAAPAITGVDEQPGRAHYLVGRDPAGWRTNVPMYARVQYRDVYPHVDLVYYGNRRQVEYDFIVKPGGRPRGIALDVKGADRLWLDERGDLVLQVHGEEVRMQRPVAYQEIAGARREVDARYVLKGRRRVGFAVAVYDASRPLVIDPTVSYSMKFGGWSYDRFVAIAVDGTGNTYLTGYTLQSEDYSTSKVSVTKLNPRGQVVYATYLGGSDNDQGFGITVDAAGNAYVVGRTESSDFPTVNPFQGSRSGSSDAFVAKLDPSGSNLLYSTYLGGTDDQDGYDIAVDAAGSATVTGWTTSTDFPTFNPLQATNAGDFDIFVTKLTPAGSALVYSTYFGGTGTDQPGGIVLDAAGKVYVVGGTTSTDLPTVNAFQATNAGGADAFLAKLDANGTALLYATYLGGSGNEGASGVAVDATGAVYLTGGTESVDFPTASAFQGSLNGPRDIFVTKLSAAGSVLVYSSYLGGSDYDSGSGIAVDAAGNVHLTGSTSSTNFPTAAPVQAANAGGVDAVVAKLDPAGAALLYSTYLGGSDSDYGEDIALDATGNAYVTGFTRSTDFPAGVGRCARCPKDWQGFVTKISP